MCAEAKGARKTMVGAAAGATVTAEEVTVERMGRLRIDGKGDERQNEEDKVVKEDRGCVCDLGYNTCEGERARASSN